MTDRHQSQLVRPQHDLYHRTPCGPLILSDISDFQRPMEPSDLHANGHDAYRQYVVQWVVEPPSGQISQRPQARVLPHARLTVISEPCPSPSG